MPTDLSQPPATATVPFAWPSPIWEALHEGCYDNNEAVGSVDDLVAFIKSAECGNPSAYGRPFTYNAKGPNGEDVEVSHACDTAAIHEAIISHDNDDGIKIIDALLSVGVDVNQPEQGEGGQRYTALHHASETISLRKVEHLLNCGADPNCRDASGRTPLHACSTDPDGYMVAVLLLTGQCPDFGRGGLAEQYAAGVLTRVQGIGGDAGRSVEDLLEQLDADGVDGSVPLLASKRCDVLAVDDSGMTALDAAREEDNDDLIEILLPYYCGGGPEGDE